MTQLKTSSGISVEISSESIIPSLYRFVADIVQPAAIEGLQVMFYV